MRECPSCHRHVLGAVSICPFCAASQLGAAAMVVATPMLLSACYGLPMCDGGDLVDQDGDGALAGPGSCQTPDPADCDDANPAVSPLTAEICDNGVDDDCDFAADAEDSDCADTDAGGTGAVSVAYTWSSIAGFSSCTEAGVTALSVVVSPQGGPAADAISYPCNDEAVLVANVAMGDWVVSITASATSERSWASDTVAVHVDADATATATVTLDCTALAPDACGGG
jgi:hypothetical protein